MNDDLFAEQRRSARRSAEPLAARMRPASLDEVVGQRHLVAPGSAFRAMVMPGSNTVSYGDDSWPTAIWAILTPCLPKIAPTPPMMPGTSSW